MSEVIKGISNATFMKLRFLKDLVSIGPDSDGCAGWWITSYC